MEPATSPFAAGPSAYAPHYTSPLHHRLRPFAGFSPFPLGYGYMFPGYISPPNSGFYGGPAPAGERPESLAGRQGVRGILYLEVEPPTAQVYVDGLYIGTVDDFSRTGVTLTVGPHRIELRAPGYEALTIEVNILAGQPTRYRGNLPLARRPAVEATPPRAPAPETFYVIPGCYAGNRPPSEVALPPGCDIGRVRRLKV